MQKQNEDRKAWLLRREKTRRVNEKRASAQRKASLRRTHHHQRRRLSVVPVPKFLAAEDDSLREKIYQTINTAHSALRGKRVKVRLDFSGTKKIYPGGMLLLLAHLHLLTEQYPGRVSARCPPHSLAAQLMNHFGIAGRLGIADQSSRPTHDSVIHWRHCTGVTADGQPISELLDSYRSHTHADLPEGLYEALTEALTNVRQHAYRSENRVPDSLQRWWLFARYVEPEGGTPGNLYIAVYDMGSGIPRTMKGRLQREEIVLASTDELFGWMGWRAGHKKLERLLLKRAVEHSRSSTGEDFRGKGLPEMREFVLQTRAGRLCIISGSAQYVCNPAATNPAATVSTCTSTSQPTLGTLILWGIPLQRKELP